MASDRIAAKLFRFSDTSITLSLSYCLPDIKWCFQLFTFFKGAVLRAYSKVSELFSYNKLLLQVWPVLGSVFEVLFVYIQAQV